MDSDNPWGAPPPSLNPFGEPRQPANQKPAQAKRGTAKRATASPPPLLGATQNALGGRGPVAPSPPAGLPPIVVAPSLLEDTRLGNGALLASGRYADLLLRAADGELFAAHRSVLEARCGLAVVRRAEAESTGEPAAFQMHVPSRAVRALLRYVYTEDEGNDGTTCVDSMYMCVW
ncbi:hypothetical protein T492DRAFT_897877 [Pavlovales sp. CCMP2436]|nr:hypothetical protein T492DRAFT_897877 [Pavlovales sp. CCMP2436]